jgi:hypothetical protein
VRWPGKSGLFVPVALLVGGVAAGCGDQQFEKIDALADELARAGLPCVEVERLGRDSVSELGRCRLHDGSELQLIVFDDEDERERFEQNVEVILDGTALPFAVTGGNYAVLAADASTAERVSELLGGEVVDAR